MYGRNSMRVEQDWAPLPLLVTHAFHQHVTEELSLDVLGTAFTMTVCELIIKKEYSLHV